MQSKIFTGLDLTGVSFKNVILRKIDLNQTIFYECADFQGAVIKDGVNFNGARFEKGINFEGAKLSLSSLETLLPAIKSLDSSDILITSATIPLPIATSEIELAKKIYQNPIGKQLLENSIHELIIAQKENLNDNQKKNLKANLDLITTLALTENQDLILTRPTAILRLYNPGIYEKILKKEDILNKMTMNNESMNRDRMGIASIRR